MSMVLVLKDWPSFKEYIEKWGYLTELVYRVDPVHAEKGMRLRVLGGRYGLDMLMGKDEPTLEEIQAFLDSKDAKKVEEVKEVEAFFS
jgi:hypothetical protein